MRAIDRKLIRSLDEMKGQAIAIGVVIACGVATYVMSVSALHALERAQEAYYDRYQFGEVFASLKRAPETLRERIGEIPGVARVQTRVVEAVTLDIEGMVEPATGMLISVPTFDQPMLNRLHLRSGRYLRPGRGGEVIANEAFVEAHGFAPGDSFKAILNGRLKELRIVGVALSPEYITTIQAGSLFPDDYRFGVFWMGEEELEAAFNMEGAFNDVCLTLMPGASEAEVIRRLDQLLDRYGGAGAGGREHHVSHRFISDEIKQLKSFGMMLPTIFFAVAAFLLNMSLRRVISLERQQIAALKAFGYHNLDVGLYYIKLVFLIVTGGVVFGSAFGIWIGRGMTSMYTEFYRFPVFGFRIEAGILGGAYAISLAAALAGVFNAVRAAVNLPPAEAMRPQAPEAYGQSLMERFGWLRRFLTQEGRIIVREIERRPVKAFLSSLGIALSVAILVIGNFMEDSIMYFTDFQFGLAERQDITVMFVEPLSGSALHGLHHVPGVIRAEPFRSVPVRLRHGHRYKRVGIMGLPQGAELFRLLDEDKAVIPIPKSGLTVSAKLAELLGAEVGDRVRVEVLEGKRPVLDVPISGLVNDFLGTSAYMDIRELNRLMSEGRSISGAYIAADEKAAEALYRELKETPMVAGVNIKTAALESFMKTFAENLLRFKAFNIFFACAIAIGVVYNTARITLSERSRDLGTLRVIGFTRREISAILLGELGVLTAAAIPLGMALGYGLGYLMSLGMDTELYRIPFVIKARSYVFAVVVVILASVISGLMVRRRLDRLDLVSVLKARME